MKKLFLTLVGYTVVMVAIGQSVYEPKQAFDPQFYPYTGNDYRSASGEPGPKYWQNRADYVINCTLDAANHRVNGEMTLKYKNNSPDKMKFLWLQMDQNIYKKDSRGSATTTQTGGRWANAGYTDGYAVKSISIEKNGSKYIPAYTITDTRMQVWLKEALNANGGDVSISISFSFDVPQYGTDRMGRLETKNGWVYEIAQWYPRICVYDDIQGWNTLPYVGAGEFYLEYGDVRFNITVPSDMIVVGSGELLNPAECFSAAELKKYNEAKASDKTVVIRGAKDLSNKAVNNLKSTTWKFNITNTRDVAWGASKAFILDAAKINLPGGKTSLAMSAYPVESTRDKEGNDWRRSTEMVKGSIEHYSAKWSTYPYAAAVNVAGIVGGMEYPGIVFCSYQATGSGLWGVTDHEFGHTWFPMIVGSNERKYAWMDEGFNTFINGLSTDAFNDGEFNEQSFFGDPTGEFMVKYVFGESMDGLFNVPEVIQQTNLGVAAYLKPALMLDVLRDVVLGPERFDAAFKEYIERWSFKHPTPWDFFHTMENVSGEDLGWFWRGWVLNTWTLDQAVKSVTYAEDKPANGADITVENLQQMVMPVPVLIKEANGKEHWIDLPVEIWQRGAEWRFSVPTTSEIKEVILDPNKKLPDVDRTNNSWKKAF